MLKHVRRINKIAQSIEDKHSADCAHHFGGQFASSVTRCDVAVHSCKN